MQQVGDFPLNEEQKLQVYEQWNAGDSASIIASRFGKSRNAIIGLIHRAPAHLITRDRKAPTNIRRQAPVERFSVKPLPVHKPELTAPEPIGPVGESSDGCQFIFGDTHTSEWRMCGCAVHKKGSSWCEYHYVKHVRNPIQPNRRRTTDERQDRRRYNGSGSSFRNRLSYDGDFDTINSQAS